VSAAKAAGWFGKMPSLGDFASRRLPPAFVSHWDTWLQQELERSHEALGAEWLSIYMVAPVRRFWLAGGAVGPREWLGVLMPSVDSVGRRFPFTIAAPRPAGDDGLAVALANRAWFDALDAVARAVLDPEFDVDRLELALQAVAPLDLAHPGDAAAALAAAVRGRQAQPGSVWWCDACDDAGQFLCAPGLPVAQTFEALLRPSA
jgi:type VI secretion system protein ImpM